MKPHALLVTLLTLTSATPIQPQKRGELLDCISQVFPDILTHESIPSRYFKLCMSPKYTNNKPEDPLAKCLHNIYPDMESTKAPPVYVDHILDCLKTPSRQGILNLFGNVWKIVDKPGH